MPKPHTPKPEIDRLVAEGIHLAEIARRTGTPEGTVRAYLKRTGQVAAAKPDQHLDQVAHIRSLARDGYGSELIADILGMTRRTVIRYASLHGIALPARSRPELINHHGLTEEARQRGLELKRRYIEWSGGREFLAQAAKRLGLHPTALAERLDLGWDVEKAMTTPKQAVVKKVTPRKVADNHPWRRASGGSTCSVNPAAT